MNTGRWTRGMSPLAVSALVTVVSALAVVALLQPSPGPAPVPLVAGASSAPSSAPAFSSAGLAAGRAALLATRGVQNVAHPTSDEWQVAVDDNGDTRFGFAESMCIVLGQAGLVGSHTVVAVIDNGARIDAGGVDVVEKARLGEIDCRTGRHLAGRTGWLLKD